jgi:flagellar motor protein MotB
MIFKGFGQNSPVAENNTEEGRFSNRRTEFMIVSM